MQVAAGPKCETNADLHRCSACRSIGAVIARRSCILYWLVTIMIVLVPVFVAPLPVFPLLFLVDFVPVAMFAMLLLQVVTIGPVLAFVPLVPVAMFRIPIAPGVIAIVVIVIASPHRNGSKQRGPQQECANATVHVFVLLHAIRCTSDA